MSPSDRVAILLVDDREADILTLRSILTHPSYELVEARSGREALRHVLHREFAVILLDAVMPDIDGFEVARILKQRERSRHIPIIFLTSIGAEMNHIYRAYSVGAVDYLSKPVDEGVVQAKVAIFVDLFRKEQLIVRQTEALREADRRERERQIADLRREGERRYQTLANAIPQIVWTADEDCGLTYVNQRWIEFTRLSIEDAMGWRWLAVVHPDDRARCEAEWRQGLLRGETFEVECRLRRHDGVYRWHLCRALPERDAAGRLTGWLGTHTDFDDLKQALSARDEFLSIASHELRTPLTALMLRLEGLQRIIGQKAAAAEPRLPGRLEELVRHCRRLGKLIDSLLDVSRIMHGQLELVREEVDAARAVREVAGRLADEAAQAGCRIELRGSESAVGRWDPLRLEQVVTNLLSNALRYGAGKPVEVSLERDIDTVRLTVTDHGVGIAPEDLRRIFNRFERAGAHYGGGLGLGLYITSQIIHAHGGTIRTTSQLGAGSTFVVELPYGLTEPTPPIEAASAQS